MNKHTFIAPLAGFLCLCFPALLSAQTCKVNVGHCSKGEISYIEVFEYDYVDIKPEFPGGGQSLLNFVNEHRHYPSDAYVSGIEGRVTCSFIVNTDGSVTNVCVIKGVCESLNSEAVRILSDMPTWTPGKIENSCVPVRVVYSVPFRK